MRREKKMTKLTSNQRTVIRSLVGTLRAAARGLDAGRESIGDVRWAGDKLAEAGLEETCAGAITMIRASIKAFGQGNDASASAYASEASERLDALKA